MIDCKKLAAMPLNEIETDSVDFCIALAVHVDQGESLADISVQLKIQSDTLTAKMTKGRLIRDRMIRENSEAMLKNVQDGICKKPFIQGRKSSLKTYGNVAFEHGVGLKHGRFRVEEGITVH